MTLVSVGDGVLIGAQLPLFRAQSSSEHVVVGFSNKKTKALTSYPSCGDTKAEVSDFPYAPIVSSLLIWPTKRKSFLELLD